MKNLTKLLTIITLLFASFHSNASISAMEKAALVTKMSNNADVIKLYKNKLAIGVIKGMDIDNPEINDQISNKISSIQIENEILTNSMMESFPEYARLMPSDKRAVTTDILNSKPVSAFWDCIGTRTATFVATVAGTGAITAVIARIRNCLFAALIVDIAGEAETGGTASAAVQAAAVPEVNFCKWLGRGSGSITAATIYQYIVSLFEC